MKQRSLLVIALVIAALAGIGLLISGQRDLVAPAETLAPNVTSVPTQTPVPTNTPLPINTPDPTAGWLEYLDPQGRFSIKYPPNWFLLEPPSDDLGYATRVTSIDLTHYEGPNRHGEVLNSEFYVWIGRESIGPISGTELSSWVEENPPSDGSVLQMKMISLAGKMAVQRDVKVFAGHTVREFFFATSEGVLVIAGEPLESPKAKVFDAVLSTVKINE